MSEIYVSTDIEADGPIPGVNSMLSFGSAAFDATGVMVSTFSANLNVIEGAVEDSSTMTWWGTQPEAWAACHKDVEDAKIVMPRYVTWLKNLPGKPVFVGYPAGFDFLFIYWYLMRFAKESPFSFSAIDLKTYAMAVLKKPYRDISKQTMPRRWFGKTRHTHVAIDDAIEQGELFFNMLHENTNRASKDAKLASAMHAWADELEKSDPSPAAAGKFVAAEIRSRVRKVIES